MSYLASALVGEAQDKISILSAQGTNYVEAWDHICECYHNEKYIVSNHIEAFLNLPAVEKDKISEGLTKLADHARMHMKALAKFDIQVTPQVVVKLLESRLPVFLVNKWEESITEKKFPNLDDMIIFIRKWAAHRSVRTAPKQIGNNSNPNKRNAGRNDSQGPSSKRSKQDSGTRSLATTTQPKPEPKCLVCNEKHWIYNCKELLALPERSRFKKVKELQLCLNCLKKAHRASDCRKGGCKKCGKKHNSLLHFETPKESEE